MAKREIRKVVIIYDTEKYDDKVILDELRAEDFAYKFKMFTDEEFMKHPLHYLDEADEIWTFGRVKNTDIYHTCITLGSDIWDMG